MARRIGCGRRKGFTLIEALIVVATIAVLASIIIPRVMGAARRSRETTLRGDLKSLRDSVGRFEGDCSALPPTLSDIAAPNGAAISADSDGRGLAVDRRGYKGPYLVCGEGDIPKDPFTGAADWVYDNATGDVHSSATTRGLNGIRYSDW